LEVILKEAGGMNHIPRGGDDRFACFAQFNGPPAAMNTLSCESSIFGMTCSWYKG
jgi:hypothetical protein